jgi:hypothetical protein
MHTIIIIPHDSTEPVTISHKGKTTLSDHCGEMPIVECVRESLQARLDDRFNKTKEAIAEGLQNIKTEENKADAESRIEQQS